jgi:hypothetical protein
MLDEDPATDVSAFAFTVAQSKKELSIDVIFSLLGFLILTVFDFRFSIFDFRFSIFDFRFSIFDFRFSIFDFRFSIFDFRF